MAGDFTNLMAWKEAIELLRMVTPLAKGFRGPDAALAASQLLQAVESISANIAEGHGKGYCPDYVRFLKIALSSGGEAESRLTSSLTMGRSKDEIGMRLSIRQAARTRSLTAGLIAFVEREIQRKKRAQSN